MDGPIAVGALSHCTQSTVRLVVKTLVSHISDSSITLLELESKPNILS